MGMSVPCRGTLALVTALDKLHSVFGDGLRLKWVNETPQGNSLCQRSVDGCTGFELSIQALTHDHEEPGFGQTLNYVSYKPPDQLPGASSNKLASNSLLRSPNTVPIVSLSRYYFSAPESVVINVSTFLLLRTLTELKGWESRD
jgi:hypothetical protein